MAKERTSVRMQEQIKTLSAQGVSIRKIAKALSMSRKTVRKLLGMSHPSQGSSTEVITAPWIASVNWKHVREEVGRGCTIKQIHREVMPEVPYLNFWRAFREESPISPNVTIRLHHKPGEKAQIDFCDGLPITDPHTGKIIPTQLFVGVLAFSSYTFGEFVKNQKLPTFLGVQERMFSFFGGVTPYVVPDNLRSGVSQAHRYDPDVNPTYCDFANHMGFAVLPARPYRPRDKGAGESAIGVIQRGFFQEVRNRTFYSLHDLNQVFGEYLQRLNHEVMKDYGVSRATRFETEKSLLKALPSSRFQLSEWRSAKVHPDCHIQVGKNFYSVPFQHVGWRVRVRLTEKTVEVFSEDSQPIAAHARLSGIGQFSTFDAHYPEAKVSVARFEVHQAKEQAKRISPSVEKLIEDLLSGFHPLRHLRRVQGILRLIPSHQVSREALDYACSQALIFKKTRLAYIRACAVYFDKNGLKPKLVTPERSPENVHLREVIVRKAVGSPSEAVDALPLGEKEVCDAGSN
jgi:transposase